MRRLGKRKKKFGFFWRSASWRGGKGRAALAWGMK